MSASRRVAATVAPSIDTACAGSIHYARRWVKTLVSQLDILETMTPMSFAGFRDRLEAASGFQSAQFREFEFLLGYKRPERLADHEPGSPQYQAVERRLHEPSVVDRFYEFLAHRGAAIPEELRSRDRTLPTSPYPEIQEAILQLYRSEPQVFILFELMTDLDEGQQEWRYRHVKMVERTIGNKHGTSGSSGVDFLKQPLFKSVFPDLWAIRHRL